MQVNPSVLRQTKGYSAPRRALSLLPMSGSDTSDDGKKGTLDPRVRAMIADIEAMLARKGWTRADLAAALGIDRPQISNILNGKQGLSIERLLNVHRVLGMVMVVREGDPQHPVRLGTINETGRLMADFKDLSFPGFVEIGPRAIGPYAPGMQVWVKAANGFELGKWVLVARDEGHDLMKCDERDGLRVLVTSGGDAMLYEPDRHAIVAVSYGRFIPE